MEGNQKNKPNITHIIIAVIVAISILGFGAMNYVSSEKDRQIEQMKIQQAQAAQQQVEEQQRSKAQSNQVALQTCLDKAQNDFNDTMQLNSYPYPQPSYPDARKWNTFALETDATQKLQDDKTLCSKLYGAL